MASYKIELYTSVSVSRELGAGHEVLRACHVQGTVVSVVTQRVKPTKSQSCYPVQVEFNRVEER